jgi:DNA-directed RNA polymerase specialized sigma24 family protein
MPHANRSVPDLTLLGRVASGDAAALRELEQRHGSSVYALAYGIVIDPGEADEVVAETFAYVWLGAGRFVETGHASVATWLGDIARSRARAVLLSREWAGGMVTARASGRLHDVRRTG